MRFRIRACRATPNSDGEDISTVLFLLLLALGIAIFGLTAYVMSWPLVATQLRDHHAQDRPLLGKTPFSPSATSIRVVMPGTSLSASSTPSS